MKDTCGGTKLAFVFGKTLELGQTLEAHVDLEGGTVAPVVIQLLVIILRQQFAAYHIYQSVIITYFLFIFVFFFFELKISRKRKGSALTTTLLANIFLPSCVITPFTFSSPDAFI